ncbi:hypothetical protein [Actinomadura rugatobispora]|uniref:Uncharacterized protein n=1 Tax=Actinomadura rugatobispora TaxID=1994 RepID=A0ABW0ZQ94_9ACTN|nr:hypothetical protein GCM10010200_060190 [Actinomadura rugatobispora]
MGLDAYVRCRCLQDGLTTEPPVPADLIVEDEDGYLDLSVPYEGNEELFHAFGEWQQYHACAHEDMEIVSVRVSNWYGYRLFQEALHGAGRERFPVLCTELPKANGGHMSPESARRALAELDRFTAAHLAAVTWLVDDETGERLIESIESYDGVFVLDGTTGRRAGVDPRGFFVRDVTAEPHREEFRAVRFTQEPVDAGHVRFRDLDSGTEAAVPLAGPVRADGQGRYPRRMRVDTVQARADDFTYILEPLRQVFRASVETGNPVSWC